MCIRDRYGSDPACLFSRLGDFDKVTYVAMGNHDSFNKYSGHYKLSKSYYSKVFQNIGIIFMDSETSFSAGSSQHTFVTGELKKFDDDPNIDWKIVVLHRPFYSAPSDHPDNEGGKTDIYMPEFDKFHVDFIIQGHNHNAQRSRPIKYKSSGDLAAVQDSGDTTYVKGKGRIVITNGTGGHDEGSALYQIDSHAAYNKYENDTDTQLFVLAFTGTNNAVATGTFYNVDNEVMDTFTVS